MMHAVRWALGAAVSALAAAYPVAMNAQVTAEPVRGELLLVWGDPKEGGTPQYQVMLAGATGAARSFVVNPRDWALVAQLQQLRGRQVEVEIAPQRPQAMEGGEATSSLPELRAVRPAAGMGTMMRAAPTTGTAALKPWEIRRQPYAVVMCKFADVATEPYTREELMRMYAAERGGAADFYTAVSRGRLSLAGTTVTPWLPLPRPRSGYQMGSSGVNLQLLAADCLGAADSQVDFSQYAGVGMHFNDAVGCCSWGGGLRVSRDGPERTMGAMWNMSWARAGTIWHELGHSFGLPHSGGPYGYTYDSRWDVMSSSSSGLYFGPVTAYGGSHFVAWHKDRLGLIPDSSRVEVSGHEWVGLISPHADGDGPGAQYVYVPLATGPRGAMVTIEARRRVGYDLLVPDEGIVIATIDPQRAEPAQIVDVDGNGNVNDHGAVWRVGERYLDPVRQVSVAVDSMTLQGWWVTVRRLDAATRALPEFVRSGVSYEVLRITGVRRDSVAVRASGAWRVAPRGTSPWLRLLRSEGSGNGWVVFEVQGIMLTADRAVELLEFSLPSPQTAPALRIEVGALPGPTDYATLLRRSRRVRVASGPFYAAFDSVAVRLGGTWSAARWTVTATPRIYLYNPQTGQRFPSVERSGTASVAYLTIINGVPVGSRLIDTIRVVVDGPSRRELLVIDTVDIDTASAPASIRIGPRQSSAPVAVGASRLDSVQVVGTFTGPWNGWGTRVGTRAIRGQGNAGDWFVWRRDASAVGRFIDTLYVSSSAGWERFTDTLTVVDVPLRLSVSRTGGRSAVALGRSARFDTAQVFVLGSAGAGATWRASTSSSTLRLHARDAFTAQATGNSGDVMRWSRATDGLAPGRYIDTIAVTLTGGGLPPALIVDTTDVLAPEQVVGDVDNDGAVTTADALLILRHLVQLSLPSRANIARTGDVNCDGQITIADALLLLQVDAGLPVASTCVGKPAGP